MAAPSGEDKLFGVLSYLGILVLIPLLVKKDSAWVQDHAKQGLVMLIYWVVGALVFWIPIIGWLLGLALFIVWIMEIIKVLGGNKPYIIPGLGPKAQKWKL